MIAALFSGVKMIKFKVTMVVGFLLLLGVSNGYAGCMGTLSVQGDHQDLLILKSTAASTQFYVRALNGQNLLLYTHQGTLGAEDSTQSALSGNVFALCLRSGVPLSSLMVIADLQKNLVSAPLANLKDFNAGNGVGVFADPANKYNLVVQPLFSQCQKPLVVALDHIDVDSSARVDPQFDQNDYYQDVYQNEVSQQYARTYSSQVQGHLIVNYRYEDGKLYSSQIFSIDYVQLLKSCANHL